MEGAARARVLWWEGTERAWHIGVGAKLEVVRQGREAWHGSLGRVVCIMKHGLGEHEDGTWHVRSGNATAFPTPVLGATAGMTKRISEARKRTWSSTRPLKAPVIE